MELKLPHPLKEEDEDDGSNCTFMELKCVPTAWCIPRKLVLIVPLWN